MPVIGNTGEYVNEHHCGPLPADRLPGTVWECPTCQQWWRRGRGSDLGLTTWQPMTWWDRRKFKKLRAAL